MGRVDEITSIFDLLDKGKCGSLNFADFVLGCQRLSAQPRLYDLELSHALLGEYLDRNDVLVAEMSQQIGAMEKLLRKIPTKASGASNVSNVVGGAEVSFQPF